MKTPQEWYSFYREEAFVRENTYTGPLGAAYGPASTVFRLWSPCAQRVVLKLFTQGTKNRAYARWEMQRGEQGVWSVEVPGDLAGIYYQYETTVEGEARTGVDPYAQSCGEDGRRGMVLDSAATAPAGWAEDVRPAIPESRRCVWEVGVRDFSADERCGVRPAWRGKFLAFTQQGTTLDNDGEHPTCLEYLKQLGISHVQLLPVFDFDRLPDANTDPDVYNWGYDPRNFNCPKGSYATDPADGAVRVQEMKRMVAALHKAGIGVVMDVVYNHSFDARGMLHAAVPYYYYRQNPDGTFSNGSGCGNEIASELPMVRKYIVDSVLHWATEYHIDGFRFDLMGVYDVDTMNAVRAALDSLPGGESILTYGEPWTGGGSTNPLPPAMKHNFALLDERIGAFCDNTRDAIKGSCFDLREGGYVSGRGDKAMDVGSGVKAWCGCNGGFEPKSPRQIVTYVSAHDNPTLYDKLLYTLYPTADYDTPDETALAMNRLCAVLVLTSKGMPFMQAGEEFARTKYGEHNSYNKPVAVNRLDWGRTVAFAPLLEYYRGLLGLRATYPSLGEATREAADRIWFYETPSPVLFWQDGPLAVLVNPTDAPYERDLEGSWQLLCNEKNSGLWRSGGLPVSGHIRLEGRTAWVLKKQ